LHQKIKEYELPVPQVSNPKEIILVLDATYFDGFGVMVFRCIRGRENLLWYFINEYETVAMYLTGIAELERRGYVIRAVVCDGKSGLIKALSARYLVQLCIFHQFKTVTRYITKFPKLEAGKELRQIMFELKNASKENFARLLSDWHTRWKTFLAEQAEHPFSGRKYFVHRRLRAAHRSLRSNLPCLFTWRDYTELKIPSTTNSLDGTFSHLKQKIHIHRGLNTETKKKAIEDILRFKKTPKNFH
jgi:transposase-like protein